MRADIRTNPEPVSGAAISGRSRLFRRLVVHSSAPQRPAEKPAAVRNGRPTLRFTVALATIALAAAQTTTVPETKQPGEINLLVGRGQLLRFDRDLTKLAVAEDKIADAVVITPREVMVNAKTSGRTTVIVWLGDEPQQYNVNVSTDTSDFDDFKKSIQAISANGTINVAGHGETIVLTGSVKSADESKRAAGLAQTRAKTVINLLQVPPAPEPRQILLQVKFAAIDRVALQQIGFNLFSRNGTMLGETSTEQFQSPRFSQLQFQNGNFSNSTVNFADLLNLFVYRPDLNIGATIKALQNQNLLQILAEPNLVTLEGKEASFLAGGSFPFPILTTTSTGGATSPVITVQFKPFGVQLTFTPTVTSSGAIDLKVSPEVSALDFANAVTLQGFTIPALSQRKADTEVVLREGESFAIAGLIDNRVIKEVAKMPGLGNIPVLGWLFKSRMTQKSTDELLVVVTPHFVKPLTPDEKAKLPEFPETFLPAVVQEQKGKSGKKGPTPTSQVQSAPDPKKAQFVGPRGYEEPK
jgi:pilus assembly protein CpaC